MISKTDEVGTVVELETLLEHNNIASQPQSLFHFCEDLTSMSATPLFAEG
jgi:hypothetical protein